MKKASEQLLRTPEVFPDDEQIENALAEKAFAIFKNFEEKCATEFHIAFDWRFYSDGKAWLCKATHKNKTVFWLSVWSGFFKTSFYFTEKHRDEIAALAIDKSTRKSFASTPPAGRLIPLIIDIASEKQLDDLFKIIAFKLSQK